MSQIEFSELKELHLNYIREAVKKGCDLKISSLDLENTENSLNKIWLSCLNGSSDIKDFKKINDKWLKEVVFLNKTDKELRLF